MKKRETKLLKLQKVRVTKLNNLNAIYGGSAIDLATVVTNPTNTKTDLDSTMTTKTVPTDVDI